MRQRGFRWRMYALACNSRGTVVPPDGGMIAATLCPFGRVPLSMTGSLQGVPEAPPQRVADLVVQQGIDRQRRILQQPGFQVRGHARLAGENGLQPERGRVPGDRLPEVEALTVGCLHRVGQGDRRLLRHQVGCGRLLPGIHALLRRHIRRPGHLGLVGGRPGELLGLDRLLVLRPAGEPSGGGSGGPRRAAPLLCGRAGWPARPWLHRDGSRWPWLTRHGARQPSQRGGRLPAGRGLVRAWLPWPAARAGHGFRAGTLVGGWRRVDRLLRWHARRGRGDPRGLGDLSARGPALVRRHAGMTLLDRGCLHPGLAGHHLLPRYRLLPRLAGHHLLARLAGHHLLDRLAGHHLLSGLARDHLLSGLAGDHLLARLAWHR